MPAGWERLLSTRVAADDDAGDPVRVTRPANLVGGAAKDRLHRPREIGRNLDDDMAAARQELRRRRGQGADQVEPVSGTIAERVPGFEPADLPGQRPHLTAADVGRVNGDNADSAKKLGGKLVEQVGDAETHVGEMVATGVAAGQCHGIRRHVETPDLGPGQGTGHRAGHGTGTASEIDRHGAALAAQRSDPGLTEKFATAAGDEDTGLDRQLETGEDDVAANEGNRLTRHAAAYCIGKSATSRRCQSQIHINVIDVIATHGDGEEFLGILPSQPRPPMVDCWRGSDLLSCVVEELGGGLSVPVRRGS